MYLIVVLIALATPAMAQKRVALVIGNAAYKETSPLSNTRNDATDMSAILKRLGFDVLDGLDLDKRAMERVIRQFEQKLAGADVALFFYAGHGIQISGQNHLVPIDARLAAEGDVDFESLPLSLVLSRMERTVKTSLVLLDACRDNPLARNLARTMGTRGASVGQGLAEVKTGIGTLISFSTQPGNVALDGDGRNSPYTSALIEEIETPGRDILTTLAAVRGAVVKATRGKQVPWEHTSLLGPVVLKEAQAPAPPAAPPPPSTTSAAAREWQDVKDTTSLSVLERYVQRHISDPVYAALAQDRIDVLKRQQQAAVTKAEADAAARKKAEDDARVKADAERQRVALLQQEDARKAAEAAKKKAEDDARAKAEAERQRLALLQQEEARKRAEPVAPNTLKPGSVFRDCSDGCPEMVVIPAGEFMMGSNDDNSEKPIHKVAIKAQFAVAKFEATFAEWDACVAAGGCQHKPNDEKWGRGRQPVINVSWDDITKDYLPWLTKKSGKTYRLLTEAEWEYAARAGTTTRYSFGNQFSNAQANNDKGKTVPVGQYSANPFGLHDMHGNVWEWVQDCWHPNYSGAPTSSEAWVNACTEDRRVIRGGSWGLSPQLLRSAIRNRLHPDGRDYVFGFRVARTL